jgi:hypothetical protein
MTQYVISLVYCYHCLKYKAKVYVSTLNFTILNYQLSDTDTHCIPDYQDNWAGCISVMHWLVFGMNLV